MPRPRIAIAGFQHETNCFSPRVTGLSDFERADSWPAMLRGADVLRSTHGLNLPIAGFAAAAAPDAELLPLLWCAAEPSGPVTDAAFEAIAASLVSALAAAGPVDGLYLDLHGAMVTETHADGEGALLGRIRDQFGADLPIAISLDLHANISPAMVALADFIAIFRTYPHLDMADTGARVWPVLRHLLQGHRFAKAHGQMPYLIPLHAQATTDGPAAALYDLATRESGPHTHAEIALGFTAADFPDTGPASVVFSDSEAQAQITLARITAAFMASEHQFDRTMLTPGEAAAQALNHTGAKPIILADVQDNPGAGASSDTTGLLKALISARAPSALLGLFCDRDIAEQAHTAGLGARITGDLGGKANIAGDTPLSASFEVLALSDGQCRYTGEMYGGGIATMGATAALRVAGTGIDLVVTSLPNQCLDLAHFTHIGLEPASYRAVCVKSTAHFRADFAPIADRVACVAAPGLFPCDLGAIPFRNLSPGMRV